MTSSDCLPKPGRYFENDLMAPHVPKLNLAQIRENPLGKPLLGVTLPSPGSQGMGRGQGARPLGIPLCQEPAGVCGPHQSTENGERVRVSFASFASLDAGALGLMSIRRRN